MSPASGDLSLFALESLAVHCFHSINVPSEWGQLIMQLENQVYALSSFHSINVPSEWGLNKTVSTFSDANCVIVSIQLMSPASGDFILKFIK